MQFICGLFVVPVECSFRPNSSLLNRVALQQVSLLNSSSGEDQNQPAGLCRVSSKLYGGTASILTEHDFSKFKMKPPQCLFKGVSDIKN